MPQITLTLEEYDAIRDRATKAEAQLAAMREAKLLDAERGAELEVDALRGAAKAVDFAVANLDPSGVIRGWATPGNDGVAPADGLERLGKALQRAPWATPQERQLGESYVEFAGFARACALQKPSRRGQPPGPMASPEEMGPQTEEARHVHATYTRNEKA